MSTTQTRRGDTVGHDLRGPGTAPAVVFVAGAGPFRAIDPVTTRTAELVSAQGVTTVVWDRLGRGESRADGRLDLDRELDAVAAMIDVAGGSAVLCGHSSGCAIALRAQAAGLPVSGLVLFEAPLDKPSAYLAAWTAEVERRISAGDLESAQEHYMVDMPPEWLAMAKASPMWTHLYPGVVSLRADGQAMVEARRALETGMGDVDVPLLALVGTETFPGMPEAAAALASAAPHGLSGEVAGVGHAWDPAAMADTLVRFARSTSRSASTARSTVA